ncbi:hypothetical protein CGLO_15073 [Colletotrichum gloeosporioides Cg-14]|jgi:predicted kinase
MGVI